MFSLCFVCKKKTNKKCGRCKIAYFCSTLCQKKGIREHGKLCKKFSLMRKKNSSSGNIIQFRLFYGDGPPDKLLSTQYLKSLNLMRSKYPNSEKISSFIEERSKGLIPDETLNRVSEILRNSGLTLPSTSQSEQSEFNKFLKMFNQKAQLRTQKTQKTQQQTKQTTKQTKQTKQIKQHTKKTHKPRTQEIIDDNLVRRRNCTKSTKSTKSTKKPLFDQKKYLELSDVMLNFVPPNIRKLIKCGLFCIKYKYIILFSFIILIFAIMLFIFINYIK